MTIETERLSLSPFTTDQLLALIEQPENFAKIAGYPAAEGLREFFVGGEVSPEWIARLRSGQATHPWGLGFAVVDKETHTVVGTTGFKGPPDENGVVEIAYGIVPSFEGRGYATETAKAVVEFAYATGSVKRVIAHTLPMANASTSVLAKCGFEFVSDVIDPEDGLVWRWQRWPGQG